MSQELLDYFSAGLDSPEDSIGMEVETSFLGSRGQPISLADSQRILRTMSLFGWRQADCQEGLATAIDNARRDIVLYELGRQNLELAVAPTHGRRIVWQARLALEDLYEAARSVNAAPLFKPILETDEDLLVVPDERDATWLDLDGREALRPLATASSDQFTIEVPLEKAVACLNRLGDALPGFLECCPQDAIWRRYIRESKAGYLESRYGGPVHFDSLEHYCAELKRHRVVSNSGLIEQETIKDIPLFVRSVWWYFRLRRYGNKLCIEVRPLPRTHDNCFENQLKMVRDIINL